MHYIRSQGVDVDDLVNRRQYGGDAPERGLWKNGSAGLVRKLDRDGNEGVDALKRFKVWKDLGAMPIDTAEADSSDTAVLQDQASPASTPASE